MKQSQRAVLRAAAAVSLLFVACSSEDYDDAVDIVAANLLAHPRADLEVSDAQCVAEAVIDELGVERLEQLGLDVSTGTSAVLTTPPMTDAEGDAVYAAYDTCLDFAAGDAAAFMAAGLSATEARCASEHYRSSPLPSIHLLLENHDTVPHPELHASVEALWGEAQTVCTG